jgi:proteasome lid subunit RPN8/RPN11
MLQIPRSHWLEMRQHVDHHAPLEACGLLAGQGGLVQKVFALRNELASPTHYRIAPKEQVRAFEEIERNQQELLAIFHSHPAGPPHPSTTDLAEAYYPGIQHLIWSKSGGDWECLSFLLDNGQIQAQEWQLIE